ncbi:hypothetical protein HY947_01155 [Candidatus Gottesmanbacteria bacterium]|nr:hypothetical protein [Candidatus Gottesmanbacteria bacterium]
MASLNKLDVFRVLQSSGLPLFSKHDLQKLFYIPNENTAYKLLQRLKREGVIQRLKPGIYQLTDSKIHDFVLANLLVKQSYISLESALSRYGILQQFPFVVTSITTSRSVTIETNKTYEYIHIAPHLYFGFVKEQEYLIATPEKALFDALYFMSKGLRSFPLDEMDLAISHSKTFKQYCKQTHIRQFQRFLESKKIIC